MQRRLYFILSFLAFVAISIGCTRERVPIYSGQDFAPTAGYHLTRDLGLDFVERSLERPTRVVEQPDPHSRYLITPRRR